MITQLLKDGSNTPNIYHLSDFSKGAQRRGQVIGKFGLLRSTVVKIEECGVDLKKVVCDLNPDAIKEADLCLVFTAPEAHLMARNIDHGDPAGFGNVKNNFCFPGTDVILFANNKEEKSRSTASEQMAVIMINTCICCQCQVAPNDGSRWPPQLHDWCKVINLDLRQAVITLKMENGAATNTFADLEFKPAHAFSSGMKNPHFTDIAPHRYNIVFYAEVSLKSLEFMQSREDERITTWNPKQPRPRPSISIISIKPAGKKHWLKLPTAPDSEGERVPTDFVILSQDGEEHGCHKAVLTARSAYFECKFSFESQIDEEEKPARMKLPEEIMTENGPRFTGETVEALLSFIYSEAEEPVSFDWSFEMAAGLVKLAHFYQIGDLLRAATSAVLLKLNPKSWCLQLKTETAVEADLNRWMKTCLSLMDSFRFQPNSLRDVGLLFDLYCFSCLLDSAELIDMMKTEIGLTLKEWVAKNKPKLLKGGQESDEAKTTEGVAVGETRFEGGEDYATVVDWMEKISALLEKVELQQMLMQRNQVLNLLENRKLP